MINEHWRGNIDEFDLELHEQQLKSPEAWFRKAVALDRAAAQLDGPLLPKPGQPFDLLNNQVVGISRMLTGMAIECWLKLVLLGQGEDLTKHFKHNLEELAKAANVDLGFEHAADLLITFEVAIQSGRYPTNSLKIPVLGHGTLPAKPLNILYGAIRARIDQLKAEGKLPATIHGPADVTAILDFPSEPL